MSDLSLKLLRAYRRDPAFRREADRTIAAITEEDRASRQEAATHLAINLNPTGAWPNPPVDDLREVVEASARESHADVVLHALHVSGGAAAVVSIQGVLHALHVSGGAAAVVSIQGTAPPTKDPADKWIAWRGSATDFVKDMRAALPRAKLDEVLSLLCDPPPRVVTYGNEKRRVGSDAEPALHPAANVAAFVLKAPALDRLLIVRSGKPGRAWELPGGAREQGEAAWRAVVREVAEESGAEFIHDGRAQSVEGCVVFYGTSGTHVFTPGDDAVEAQWFDKSEVGALQLSDLPTAKLIREWAKVLLTSDAYLIKPGMRVITRNRLEGSAAYLPSHGRRINAAGEVVRRRESAFPRFDVRHDDGHVAPYDVTELLVVA